MNLAGNFVQATVELVEFAREITGDGEVSSTAVVWQRVSDVLVAVPEHGALEFVLGG